MNFPVILNGFGFIEQHKKKSGNNIFLDKSCPSRYRGSFYLWLGMVYYEYNMWSNT